MIRHDDDPRKDKNEKEATSDEDSTKQQHQMPCFNKKGLRQSVYVFED